MTALVLNRNYPASCVLLMLLDKHRTVSPCEMIQSSRLQYRYCLEKRTIKTIIINYLKKKTNHKNKQQKQTNKKTIKAKVKVEIADCSRFS